MTRPLYIVLRNDLMGMVPGRAAAQASHGTSLFHEAFRNLDVSSSPAHSFMKQEFHEWKSEAGNFGTTIVLQASFKEIVEFVEFAEKGALAHPDKFSFWYSRIVDPEYHVHGEGEVFVGTNILTGAAFFLPEESGSAYSEDLYFFLKKLSLY